MEKVGEGGDLFCGCGQAQTNDGDFDCVGMGVCEEVCEVAVVEARRECSDQAHPIACLQEWMNETGEALISAVIQLSCSHALSIRGGLGDDRTVLTAGS